MSILTGIASQATLWGRVGRARVRSGTQARKNGAITAPLIPFVLDVTSVKAYFDFDRIIGKGVIETI